MVKFSVDIPEYVVSKLDAEAERLNVPRAEVIRDAIMGYLQARRDMEPEMDLSEVAGLIHGASGFFGLDVEKLVRMAKEKGLVGEKFWTEKALMKLKERVLSELDRTGLFGLSEDEYLDYLTGLDVDRDRLKEVLFGSVKGSEKVMEKDFSKRFENLEKNFGELLKRFEKLENRIGSVKEES